MNTNHSRRGFTLVELLIVISIIGIIAGLSMAALLGAAEEGRVARAESQIQKIDQLISEKWNGYRFRQLPIRIPAGTLPPDAARMRLEAIRELQRFEMPDRLSDFVIVPPPTPPPTVAVLSTPAYLLSAPAASRSYQRKVQSAVQNSIINGTPNPLVNTQLEQSECLYLILSEMKDGDSSALSFFMNSEFGDLDGDGLLEILDPWGTPVVFLRWAPGFLRYQSDDAALAGANIPKVPYAVSTFQTPLGLQAPDTFDPLKIDPRWGGGNPPYWSNMSMVFRPFQLRPLILSAGPDRRSDIAVDFPGNERYATTPNVANDPYVVMNGDTNFVTDISQPATAQWRWMGVPCDLEVLEATGEVVAPQFAGDNITNHGLELTGD